MKSLGFHRTTDWDGVWSRGDKAVVSVPMSGRDIEIGVSDAEGLDCERILEAFNRRLNELADPAGT